MLNRKFYWNEYSSKFAIAIADAEAGAWLSEYVWNNIKKFTDTFWSGLFINKKREKEEFVDWDETITNIRFNCLEKLSTYSSSAAAASK